MAKGVGHSSRCRFTAEDYFASIRLKHLCCVVYSVHASTRSHGMQMMNPQFSGTVCNTILATLDADTACVRYSKLSEAFR